MSRRSFRLGLAMVAVLAYGFSSPAVGHASGAGTTTTVSISSSHNPSGYGELVVLNATVVPTSGSGTPTGTVTFFDGATVLGSGTLNSNGQAALALSSLPVGSHSVTAHYGGDASFVSSTSGILTEQVNQQGTMTLSLSTLNPAKFGQAVVLVAIVSANNGSATPAGSVTFTDGSTVLATVPLDSSGTAAYSTATLAVGSHPITASYLGNGNFTPSVDASLTETITKTTSATSLAPSANPVAWASPLTLSATVTNPSTTGPTGTVTFVDGATTLGSSPLDSSGHASLTTSSLSPGSHSLTAIYSGDGNETGSTSSAVNESVVPAATATALSSSANPDVFGDPVTVSADVTSAAGTPSGNVTFFDGSASLGSAGLNSGGHASLTTTFSVGTHHLTASYAGNAFFAAGTSANLDEVIGTQPAGVALNSSLNPSVYGSAVTFTASVTAAHGVPTGTVTFNDGATALGSAPIDGTGTATLTTSSLTVGGHPVTAAYSGDGNDSAATSAVLNQTVQAAPSATSVASSLNPANAAQAITFTATVTASAAAPTGTVTFADGSTTLGSATVDGTGHAAITVAALAAGTHTITATYSGDKKLGPSSGNVSQVVTTVPTSTTLASSSNPATFGSSVTFTATVSSGTAGTPTGTVTFRDGSTVIGTVALTGAGTAALTTSSLTVGGHAITATYGGDVTFAASTSDALTEQITTIPTITSLNTSLNPSAYGSAVTFTATVTSSSGTPTGSVTFFDGTTALGTVVLSGGTAALSTSALGVGTHAITATYSGATTFAASGSGVLSQQVTTAGTTTSLISSANPSTFGSPVTLTATVSGAAPSGTVTFLDGAAILGSASLSAGSASLTLSSLAGGVHSLTASYGGDGLNAASTSGTLAQEVAAAPTTTALISSLNPAGAGMAVTFTATVTSGAGTPQGSVQFTDGATVLAIVASNSGGAASFTTSSLTLGSHDITAQFIATNNFATSTSTPALIEQITANPTTTTLGSSANPSGVGLSVTFTATVTAAGGTPTGAVTFSDGSTTLGTMTLSSGGTATLSTSSLAVGSHPIRAAYSGAATFAPSSSATLTEQITPVGTATTLISSANPSAYHSAVTFKATVATSQGTPSGSVTFRDGATALGTVSLASGSASLSVATLTGGSHSITAAYSGDATHAGSTSGALTQVVTAAPTATTLSASLNPATAGTTVTFTATATSGAGIPQGSVQFLDGAAVLATATADSTGRAAFTTTTLSVGTHSVSAHFVANNNFSASTSNTIAEQVNAGVGCISTWFHRCTQCPTQLQWINPEFGRGICDPDAWWWPFFVDWLKDHHQWDVDHWRNWDGRGDMGTRTSTDRG